MENRLRRIEVAIIILLGISVYNLAAPLFKSSEEPITEETTEVKELPEDVTREYLDKTVYKIKTSFNRSNWNDLYNIFGEYAKAQISLEDVEQGFVKLKTAVGSIGTYSHSHHIYEGNESNAEWFEIHYKCRFDNGKGTIKVSTRTADGSSEIVGVNIVLDEF